MPIQQFLVALALVGIVDAVSYMVVAPSIIFYVLENGGTKEDYGVILSAFSFASFCGKPFVGYFSDHFGFRVPYFVTLILSAAGGVLYLIAGVFNGRGAIGFILVARLLGGIGASSAALGFAYLAKAVPHDEQTKTNSVLSMTRILGMCAGPAFNVLLARVDTTWCGLHIDQLNSVGLVLLTTNILAALFIFFLLEEPESDHSAPPDREQGTSSPWTTIRSLCSLGILVPILGIFTFNANFQLIETGLAPAAHHALGWTPVAVSGVLGLVSVRSRFPFHYEHFFKIFADWLTLDELVVFANMMVVFSLSARKVRDETILMIGCLLSTLGYFMVWFFWTWRSSWWNFVLPVIISISGFPFLAAPTRSVFTKAVDNIESLKDQQGSMQALLSMFASVAGFVTPGLVAAYILRSPEEVEISRYHRELSPYSLFAPLMMILFGMGVIAFDVQSPHKTTVHNVQGDVATDEQTKLVHSQKRPPLLCKFSTKCEVERRKSATVMGIVQTSMYDEHPSLYEDN